MNILRRTIMGQRALSLALTISILALWAMTTNHGPAVAQESETPPQTGEFEVDNVHSMALFSVRHLGAGNFYGRFNDIEGRIILTESDENPLSARIRIPVAGVDTGLEKLDDHLKNADFFDIEKNPDMSFQSSSSKRIGDGLFEVSGTLSMAGMTRPVKARVEHAGVTRSPRGIRTGFEATFTVKRSEFGMKYGLANNALGDDVKIIVSVEALPPSAEAPRGERGGGGGGSGGMKGRLMAFDKDKDGKLTKDELPAAMGKLFDRMDVNEDGFLDEKELDNPPPQPVGGGR